MEELKFKAVAENGDIVDCEPLFTFEIPELEKHYIVYTDNTVDEEGYTRVYASVFDPKSLKPLHDSDLVALDVKPIETEEEWALIQDLIDENMSDE